MYQPPQKRQQQRYFGLSGTRLNTGFLILVVGAIAGALAWLFAYGGADSLNDSVQRVKTELTLLVNGRDVPAAAVDAPDTWVTVHPNDATEQAVVGEVRATNPELAATLERAFSYFGGLEILYFAFDPQSPAGSITSVNVLGQRYSSSTTLEKELPVIEKQLSAQGITIASVTRDLSIGGSPAAMVAMRYNIDGVDLAGVQYAILAEPNLVFAVTFVTSPERIDALTPTFQQIAETFRVLED